MEKLVRRISKQQECLDLWDTASKDLLKWKNPESFAEQIHDLRVLGKKLRALYYFFKPILDCRLLEKEKHRVKMAMSSLGSIRDSHVSLDVLRKIKKDDPQLIIPNEIDRLLEEQSLEWNQNQSFSNGEKMDASKKLASAMEVLLEAKEKLLSQLAKRAIEKKIILERLTKGFQAVKKTMQRAIKEESADSFHRWRLKTKRFYYLLDLCMRQNASKELSKVLKKFKQIEQLLGQAHDFHVLASFLMNRKYLKEGQNKSFKNFILLLDTLEKEKEKKALSVAKKVVTADFEKNIQRIVT
ncbi:metal-chelation protein CHAD [Methylacidiphilum sp. Yel]|jgi:CHAD domain-containing protein|uniref:CHAD domain-containing protein n=1 Tax=Methylacidiphilum sp. Yel TaxID=1847730 RepID=UPI0010697D9F|nr:CHAD domain-containing protein [Methylacidiphilum sp. Yel]TFE67744.1 metal-chelation protein CHAD [Methylacidiphilum sp. Yel]